MLKNSAVEQNQARGFTIVELLIVVVVIAILAAITIVSYNGIQNRTHDSTIQSDLRHFGQKVNLHFSEFNTYPNASVSALTAVGIKPTTGSYGAFYETGGNQYNLLYCVNNTTPAVAIIAGSKSGKVYVYRNGSVSETTWGGGSGGTCSTQGVVSPSHYWLYGMGPSNKWEI